MHGYQVGDFPEKLVWAARDPGTGFFKSRYTLHEIGLNGGVQILQNDRLGHKDMNTAYGPPSDSGHHLAAEDRIKLNAVFYRTGDRAYGVKGP